MTLITARRATLLCMMLFLAQPIQFGAWLSRIADVQATLGLSKSTLAFALLGMPVGLLPTLYFAGRIIDRVGVRLALLWAFPLMLATGCLAGLATSAVTLFLGLMLLGACFAFTEIGLNVFAARTEQHFGITIMNRAHGFWSLGVMLGSLIAVQLARIDLPTFTTLALTGAGMLPVVLMISASLPGYQSDTPQQAPAGTARLPAGLVPIILVVFGATLAEGSMNDWATVYMRETPWGGTARDGLAVTVFAGLLTLGRFVGDSVNMRFGPAFLARVCLAFALTGVATLVMSNAMWLSFVGFGLVGLGVSAIFPLGVSATAQLSPVGQARNVSVMTFGALSGFLIGPPVIGLVAESHGLKLAFCLLLPPLLASFVLAGRLGARP